MDQSYLVLPPTEKTPQDSGEPLSPTWIHPVFQRNHDIFSIHSILLQRLLSHNYTSHENCICVFRTWTRGSITFPIPLTVVPHHQTSKNTLSGPDHALKLFQVASCSFWDEGTRTTQSLQNTSHSFLQYHDFVFLSILLLIMPILLGFLTSEVMCSGNSAISSDLPPRNLMASPEPII